VEFKPSEKLKLVYWLYSLWFIIPMTLVILGIAFYTMSVAVSYEGTTIYSIAIVPLAILLTILAVVLVVLAVWIPRFYRSITFKLEKDHAYARFGVWWVKEKRVPYNLISEVRLRQGPLQRRFGLCNVDLFTPATGTMRPELTYFQLKFDEGVKIMKEVRKRVGILSAKERRVVEEEILNELKKIRNLLEEYVRK